MIHATCHTADNVRCLEFEARHIPVPNNLLVSL
jgi:hypothetical protein